MELNNAQQLAAAHGDGAALVLAGPGSGKTTVITERVRRLVEERGVSPGSILVITFSRAAAYHMKKRFEDLTSHHYSSVDFGTFHAIFFNIIKSESHYDHTSIISDEERFRVIRGRMRELHIESDRGRELPMHVLSAISAVKGAGCSLSDISIPMCGDSEFADLYRTYCDYLAAEGKLDFDDMMIKCLELFDKDPKVLKKWQERYRYILIDEFQDINPLQYRLVKLLAAPENNIFAVGDDDQSIYGFRGADPELMFSFEKDLPGTKRMLLGVNYRSASEITDAAARLVGHNKKRFSKRLVSSAGSGGVCEYRLFQTLEEENGFITEMLLRKKEEGKKLSDTAVLFRMKHEVTGLYRMLTRAGIRCSMAEKLPSIFDSMIAEDLIAYLKIAEGRHERSDILRVINRPNRYVTRQSVQAAGLRGGDREMAEGGVRARENFIGIDDLIWANRQKSYVVEALECLKVNLGRLKAFDVRTAIKYIRMAMGYNGWIEDYAKEKGMTPDEMLDTAAELEASAEGCETLDDWIAVMEDYRSAQADAAGRRDDGSGVTLMTFHASKGLEFETVFIIDMAEGYVPSNRAKTEKQIEEERRALYVAMTRAARELYLLGSRERLGRASDPSRFIAEIGCIEGHSDT